MKRLILTLGLLLCSIPTWGQVSTKIGTFQTGTGTTAISPTSFGFQPRVVCMWTTYPGDAGDGANNYSLSFGCMTDEATDQQRGIWMGCDQGEAPNSDCNQIMYDDRVARVYNGGTTLVGDLNMTSFDADGFTVTPVDAFTSDTTFGYWAIGGTDITDASLDTISRGTGTGQYSTTAPGFQPNFLMLFSTAGLAAVGTAESNAVMSLGFTDGTNTAVMATEALDNQATSDTRQYTRSAASQLEIFALTIAATGVSNRDSFFSFNATGFTLDAVENSGNARSLFALTIKGGQWRVGDLLSVTSVTSIAETGVGFTPKGLVFLKSSQTAGQNTSDTSTAGGSFSLGAATSSTVRFAMQTAANDNNASNNGYFNNQSTAKISLRHSPSDNVLQGDIDFTSLDADGFTLAQEDADPAQFFCVYFVVGDNAAVTGQKRQRRFRW